jgi:putative transposase
VSLYAGGMTIRDIGHHLAATIGTELSHETISKITDAVCDEVLAWQQRPLEALYPVIYLDAIIVKVRDGGHVRNKAAHTDGIKHVLGIWVQTTEGAKFWASVCAELANRGVRDVLIVCCDGLTGFPEAIAATWPQATVQTCVVHLIRAAMRFVNYGDRKAIAAALRPIYTAANADGARIGFSVATVSRGQTCVASVDGGGSSRDLSVVDGPIESTEPKFTNALGSA